MSQTIARTSGTVLPLVEEGLRTPLYHQVYLVLRNKIYDGEYADGALLPSEQETAQMFGVSRITTQRALNELAAEGLCVREQGRGSRVTFKPPAAVVQADAEGLFENLLQMGLKTEVEVLEFDYVPAGADVARALRLEPGQEVQRSLRIRRLDGKAFSHLTTCVPADIGRTFGREDLAKQPLLVLLERGGIKVSGAEQTISANLADALVARALGMDLGSPLLSVSRVVYDRNDRPVEYITGLYRPDRYQYRMTLSRVGDERARSWSLAG